MCSGERKRVREGYEWAGTKVGGEGRRGKEREAGSKARMCEAKTGKNMAKKKREDRHVGARRGEAVGGKGAGERRRSAQ